MSYFTKTKDGLNNILAIMNLKLVNKKYTEEIYKEIESYKGLINEQRYKKFQKLLSNTEIIDLVNLKNNSRSQLNQDIFVLDFHNHKENGFFVEFGATDGVKLSNSHLLEKEFYWTGILAEPSKEWHKLLKENRNCFIETDCIWSRSGDSVPFVEAEAGELSTVQYYLNSDIHSDLRKSKRKYNVDTLSLSDLLGKYNAPRRIEYLSVDTEGSEYEILREFPFTNYSFGVITCEHNYGSNREKIFKLLTSQGYKRVNTEVSDFDDWYINTKW